MSPAPFPSATSTWHDTSYPSISVARPELSAANKSVLITGGGTGIGAATAHSFAQAGATRIAILGRREKPLLETKAAIEAKYPSVHVFTAPTDVTNKDEVDSAFAKFLQDGKQTLDVLVHSAAIIGPLDPAATVAAPDFLAAVTANLSGALNVLQAFKRYATPGAAVAIDINSGAAHISFGPGFAAYSVSKMAVYRLFDSFGQANVGNGVRVYHLQPGSVDTDMNRQAGGVAAIGVEDHPSLPADFSVWLASPESKFLAGKFLWANWDVDELKARAEEIESSTQFDIQLVGWPFSDTKWKFGGPVNGGDENVWGNK